MWYKKASQIDTLNYIKIYYFCPSRYYQDTKWAKYKMKTAYIYMFYI